MSEKTVMDEVNAALGDVVTGDSDELDTDAASSPDSEGDLRGGDSDNANEGDEPAKEGEGETEEGEPEGEPERGPNGERERNPDGTWKKAAAEPKLDKDGKPIPDKKAADPVNDPIPAGLKKEAQERFKSLIDTVKTTTAERDQIKQDFDYLIKGVEATGTTPQQYGETLSWLSLFNSRDPAQQEKALELVESVAERLAMLLGKERTVGDPLSAHSDLKDAVAKGQITAQYAKEIARTRNGQQFRTELTTSASKAEQERQAAATELATARADLTALEQTLMSSDPQYAAKKAILVPALKPVFASIPPSQWKQKFTEAYRNIQVNAPAAKPKGAPTNQPLRAGKQPAGGQTKAPGSMLEAVSGALAGMGK